MLKTLQFWGFLGVKIMDVLFVMHVQMFNVVPILKLYQ